MTICNQNRVSCQNLKTAYIVCKANYSVCGINNDEVNHTLEVLKDMHITKCELTDTEKNDQNDDDDDDKRRKRGMEIM